jgi:subtilisin family serine protease
MATERQKRLADLSLILVFLYLALLGPNCGFAQTNGPSRRQSMLNAIPQGLLNRLAAGEPQEVIVEFDSAVVETEAGILRTQRGLAYDDRDLIEFKSQRFRQIKDSVLAGVPPFEANVLIDYSHLPMALLRLRSGSALQRMLDSTEVIAVYENQTIYLHLAQSLPLIDQPEAASAGYTGSGTTVAVLDTGVNYTLADFGSCTAPDVPSGCKVSAAVEIAEEDGSLDANGHGTNVSAIVVGVAPDSRIAALDVFNPDGTSTSGLVISGINWAIANRSTYNIVAINMSLGDSTRRTSPCSTFNPYLTPVNNARGAGILPVASSGNNGYTDGISSPACTPGVISVGAVYDANVGGVCYGTDCSLCTDSTTAADKVTCFSNSASFLTLLAPGAAIAAGGYTKYGTSQAAPHVAGAIALLREAYPSETLDVTTSRLTSTGQPVTDPRNAIVKPRLNLFGALDIAPPAPVALAATSVTATGFSANWNAAIGATGYRLDVSPDSGFGSFVAGYNNRDVANVTNYAVTGLDYGTYHYRLRAYNAGGTSGNSNTVSVPLFADTAPDPFVFTDQTGMALNMEVISNSITVTGINAPAPISITGGEYSINGGAFTAASGAINNGDSIRVKLLSSAFYSTTTEATLDMGGVIDTFSVTTMPLPVFVITATAGADGIISPSGAISVSGGASQSFIITPDPGCRVADVLIDGAPAGAVESYTFTDVVANHTISASFAPDTHENVPALSLPGVLLLSGALAGMLLLGGRRERRKKKSGAISA